MSVSGKNSTALFKDQYSVGKILGRGGFATVKLCTEKATGKQYACKVMQLPSPAKPGSKDTSNDSTREDVFYEINVLCGLIHPNVTVLKEYFEEGNLVYLVMELVKGGELLEALMDKGFYSEEDTRNCFKQLLEGIEYLHSKNVAHRDLKLENLLLTEQGKIDNIKIADFGLSKQQEAAMETICGSPQYVAPEILTAQQGVKYGKEVDLWSAGVILFMLLSGYPPFYDENEPMLFRKIQKAHFEFDDPVWEEVSDQAKNLIAQLLTADPRTRLTATQALAHPWVGAKAKNVLLKGTMNNIKKDITRISSTATFNLPDIGKLAV
eukprot:1040838-Prorocentrum_minimum.AAC.1